MVYKNVVSRGHMNKLDKLTNWIEREAVLRLAMVLRGQAGKRLTKYTVTLPVSTSTVIVRLVAWHIDATKKKPKDLLLFNSVWSRSFIAPIKPSEPADQSAQAVNSNGVL